VRCRRHVQRHDHAADDDADADDEDRLDRARQLLGRRLDVQESVKQGRSFSAPLEKAEVFPAMVSQMVAVGEESGTLPDMLASIAEFYDDSCTARTASSTL
jgi:type II secretory pathway component PulF